jgi:hypothetical protein
MAAVSYDTVALPGGLPDRTARASFALGAVAFTYMHALQRSDWGATPGLLALFQQLYNENRQAVLIHLTPDAQLTAARILPRALAVNGQYDGPTRTALGIALFTLFHTRFDPGDMDTMPQLASELGAWFNRTIVSRVPQTDSAASGRFAWSLAQIAAGASMVQAATDVGGIVKPFILGGTSAVPDVVATGGSSTGAARDAVNEAQRSPLETTFSALLVTAAPPKKFPDWGYYVAGAGILGLGGLLGYLNWKRRH